MASPCHTRILHLWFRLAPIWVGLTCSGSAGMLSATGATWEINQDLITISEQDSKKTHQKQILTVRDHRYRLEIFSDRKKKSGGKDQGDRSLVLFDGRDMFSCQSTSKTEGVCVRVRAGSNLSQSMKLYRDLGGTFSISEFKLHSKKRRKKVAGYPCDMHQSEQKSEGQMMGTTATLEVVSEFCAASPKLAGIPAPFAKYKFNRQDLREVYGSDALIKTHTQIARLGVSLESKSTETMITGGVGALFTGSAPKIFRTTVTTRNIRKVAGDERAFRVPKGYSVSELPGN